MASSITTANSTWTTPRTYTTGEIMTKAILDVHIRDNLNALKTPASFYAVIDQGADYTTTGTSFAVIDATYLTATVTTGGGKMLIGFQGNFGATATLKAFLELYVDGAAFATNDGLTSSHITTSQVQYQGFTVLVTGLSAASHTFAVYWKTSTSTLTLYAGAGTGGLDTHPQFWGIELA